MPLSVDAHGKGSAVIAASQTTGATLGGSATQLFVGVVWQGGGATITDVAWNGVSLGSALITRGFGSGLDTHASLYAMKSPASGTHDIVVTASASPGGGLQTYYLSTTGGDTTTGWRAAVGRQDADGAGPGVTDAGWTSDDMEIHLAAVWESVIIFDAGETAQTDDNITGSNWSAGMSYKLTNGTVGCTDATSGGGFYAECAVAAIPAASGGGGSPSPVVIGKRLQGFIYS